jgi:hypothetical protein
MSTAALIDALALPQDARVDQRVPKKLLVENGAPTAADKRQINDGIEELLWIAALKPSNIGVPEYRDEVREYLEIAVLSATLRPEAKSARLTELIHRAIPYPVVLASSHGDGSQLSLAHKRFSHAETGSVVAEDVETTAPLHPEAATTEETSFFQSLAIAAQPARDLFALYQGWCDRVAALAAARITGRFALLVSPEQAKARGSALIEYTRLQREIASLRAQALKEKQLNRRVELNLTLKRLEAQLAEAIRNL